MSVRLKMWSTTTNSPHRLLVMALVTMLLYRLPMWSASDVATADVNVAGLKGDANSDGEVDIADAVHIVNFVVGKIDQLAPQKDMDQTEPE